MNKKQMLTMWGGLMILGRFAQPAAAAWENDGVQAASIKTGPRLEISGLIGAAIPVANEDSIGAAGRFDSSFLMQGSAIFQAMPAVGLGLEGGHFFRHDFQFDDPYLRLILNPQDHISVFQLTPVIQVGQWIGTGIGSFKPYAIFGGGLYHVRETLSIDPLGYGHFEDSASSDHGGINAGAGLLYRLGESIAVGPDIRYHQIFANHDFHYITTTLRVALLF